MKVLNKVSTVADGTMLDRADLVLTRNNQIQFLEANDINAEATVRVCLTYDQDDYCRYQVVDQAHGGEGIVLPNRIIADALYTKQKGVALFLPLADCIGAVIYDQSNEQFGVLHLGRHNLEQNGGYHSIEFYCEQFKVLPEHIKVYLSPAAGKSSYPMFSFDNRSLHEVAVEQIVAAGVHQDNIQIDTKDTTVDKTLFSHSEFLKGNQQIDGRHAIVAIMR